jgi:membrane carboxypeptidase/penicillin-binding protein
MSMEKFSSLAGANRLMLPSAKSRCFSSSVLVREDARFYEHKGVIGKLCARWCVTLRAFSQARRQHHPAACPKQLPLGAARLAESIAKEVAFRIEHQFTKQQIRALCKTLFRDRLLGSLRLTSH